MTEWLSSPIGVEFTHAVILLITALAAYVSYLAHRQAAKNEKLLNGHIDHHVMDAAENNRSIDKVD